MFSYEGTKFEDSNTIIGSEKANNSKVTYLAIKYSLRVFELGRTQDHIWRLYLNKLQPEWLCLIFCMYHMWYSFMFFQFLLETSKNKIII